MVNNAEPYLETTEDIADWLTPSCGTAGAVLVDVEDDNAETDIDEREELVVDETKVVDNELDETDVDEIKVDDAELEETNVEDADVEDCNVADETMVVDTDVEDAEVEEADVDDGCVVEETAVDDDTAVVEEDIVFCASATNPNPNTINMQMMDASVASSRFRSSVMMRPILNSC